MAENAAWKFAKEHGIDVITIHPGLVIGPLLQPSVNSSAVLFLNLLKGLFQNLLNHLSNHCLTDSSIYVSYSFIMHHNFLCYSRTKNL